MVEVLIQLKKLKLYSELNRKIILNSSILDFELINKISSKFGEQSLVACIDYKKDLEKEKSI